jgi:metallo-beta-lactamase class B
MRTFLAILLFTLCSFESVEAQESIYRSQALEIHQISPNAYLHISYLNTDDFGRVACNGLVVIHAGEAIVLDTPVDREASLSLIHWIEQEMGAKVKGVIATHFHNDCLGGLESFHHRSVPSFANEKTIQLARKEVIEIPQNGFKDQMTFQVGNLQVESVFLGEGHTTDNVVCYVKEEKLLFGGCLVKEVGAGKGFLGDANLLEWSNTIQRVREKFPETQWVIPGHGKWGGQELLEYTQALFR